MSMLKDTMLGMRICPGVHDDLLPRHMLQDKDQIGPQEMPSEHIGSLLYGSQCSQVSAEHNGACH